MRKLNLKLVGYCLFVLCVAFACLKNEKEIDFGLEIELLVLPDGQALKKNPISILEYIVNKDDSGDLKIKKQRYELGLIVRNLFKDESYNEVLINNAFTKDNTAVCLQWFVNELSLKTGFNSNPGVLSDLQMKLNSLDFTRISTNPLKQGVVEEYIPVLFLINPETADHNKQPFISPGIEVNAEIPGLEEFDDYIVVWFSDEFGDFHELLIDEKFAMSTTNPIFSVDNAESEITYRPKTQTIFTKSDYSITNQETAVYYTYDYRINHRYERNGPSEFTITAARIDQDGGVHTPLRNSNGTVTLWKEIAEVKKDDIGKNLGKSVQFCNEAPIPFDKNFIFFNTYERDWWESDKSLGSATRNGVTIYLSGRRTYSSEWYAYDPGELNDNPIDMSTVYHNWSELHANSKGHLRFWRVQP